MRKFITPLLLVPALAIGGCAMFGGGGGGAPDEFLVVRNAPLIIPPDYTLTPPVAGTAAVSPADVQGQAIDALFGGPAPRSNSERSLLDNAGRDRALVGARSSIGDTHTRVVDKGAVTSTILATGEGNSRDARVQVSR
jgi:hypothetical protein